MVTLLHLLQVRGVLENTDLNGASENLFHAKMARTMAQPKKNTVTNVITDCVTMDMLLDASPPARPPSRSESFLALISEAAAADVVAFLPAAPPELPELGGVAPPPPPPPPIDTALFVNRGSASSDSPDSDRASTEAAAARRSRKQQPAVASNCRHINHTVAAVTFGRESSSSRN